MSPRFLYSVKFIGVCEVEGYYQIQKVIAVELALPSVALKLVKPKFIESLSVLGPLHLHRGVPIRLRRTKGFYLSGLTISIHQDSAVHPKRFLSVLGFMTPLSLEEGKVK